MNQKKRKKMNNNIKKNHFIKLSFYDFYIFMALKLQASKYFEIINAFFMKIKTFFLRNKKKYI